jgi:hypothetical protein
MILCRSSAIAKFEYLVGSVTGSADDLVVGAFCMYWKRRLPHWIPENTIVFVTFHLAGSKQGARRLADEHIAKIVEDALLYGASQGKYDLHAWVIMPNHVHLIIEPKAPLNRMIQWLKTATANRANAILRRTGQTF